MSTRHSVTLVLIAVVAVFATLSIDSVWLDEAYSASMATQYSVNQLWTGVLDAHHPPLYYVILHWFAAAFGTAEGVIRLPSAIAFVINIALVVLLTYRLQLGLPAATLAAVLVSLSPLHVWYAQEARMYALVMTATLLFAGGLVLNSWTGAIIATAALTASLFLDFTAVPLVVTILAIWSVRWWHQGRHSGHLLRTVAVVGVAAFLAQPVWRQLSDLLPQLDRVTVFNKVAALLGVERIPGAVFIALLAVAAVAVAATSALVVRLAQSPAFMSVAARWVPIPFLILTLVAVIPRGYAAKPIVAVAWPFVTIAVAWLMTASDPRRLRWLIVVCALAATATIATPRADWRSAVRHIDQHHSPGEMVWLDPPYNSIPYNYYHPRVTVASGELLSRAAELAPGSGLWLIAERFGKAPPTSPSEEWLDAHMTLDSAIDVPRLELRRYVRRVAQ